MNIVTKVILAALFTTGLSMVAPAAADACGYLTINYQYSPEVAQAEDNVEALQNDVEAATAFLEQVTSDGSSPKRVSWASYRVKALNRKLRRERAKLNTLIREERLARVGRFGGSSEQVVELKAQARRN